MATETEWTNGGSRVVVELIKGSVILTLHSRALVRPAEDPVRVIWEVSQLGISIATPQIYGERLVRHWLSFFDDAKLVEDGVAAFRTVFTSVAEMAGASTGSPSNSAN